MLENYQIKADTPINPNQSDSHGDGHNAFASQLYDRTNQGLQRSTSDTSNLNQLSTTDKSVPKLTLSDQSQSLDKIDKPGNYSETVMVDGTPRQFLLHVPPNYDPSKPMPLEVVLHGHGNDPAGVENMSHMDDEADKHGFIVAYPESTQWLGLKQLAAWDTGNGLLPPGQHANDVGFLRQVMDNCQSRLSVDPKRIYLVGYSNGGMEAYKAAGELSDKLAAVVAVSGAMSGAEVKPNSPVSMLSIVGTGDPVVPPAGETQEEVASSQAPKIIPLLANLVPALKDELNSPMGLEIAQILAVQAGIVPQFKPVTYATDFFKSADGINAPDQVVHNGAITTDTYTNPKNGVTVEQEVVDGANHMVQGGTPAGYNLPDEIWNFLATHPKTS